MTETMAHHLHRLASSEGEERLRIAAENGLGGTSLEHFDRATAGQLDALSGFVRTDEPTNETSDEPTNEPSASDDAPRYAISLKPASRVPMDRPRWVWDDRIPVGGTTLMPGREGLGKTLLACHIAARLTRGQLSGEWHGRAGRIIYVGHEDDRATVLVPRLKAAGADLDRFLFVDIAAGGSFSLSVDTEALGQAAKAVGDIALIIIDPLDSHLGSIDSHKKAEVQSAVARLAELAQDLRCGALGLAHFSKAATTDLLTKVVGSVGFTTAVRSVLAVGEHPDDRSDRLCVLAKANMTDRSAVPAIRFRSEGVAIDHPLGGRPIETARVVVLAEEDGVDPDSLLKAAPSEDDRSQAEEAGQWLLAILRDGDMLGPAEEGQAGTPGHLPKKVVEELAKGDHAMRTVERAAKDLGVKVTRTEGVRGRPAIWTHPDYSPGDYSPKRVARKKQPSDKGKQPSGEGSPPAMASGEKPPQPEMF